MDGTPTWEDAVEDLQLVGILPPQTQHVVLPADHLSQNEHDWNGGQSDKKEQWIGPLHHVQPFLMANHLSEAKKKDKANKSCTFFFPKVNLNRCLFVFAHLHYSDGSIRDCSPVDGAHHDASCSKRACLGDEPVCQVQHINDGSCTEPNTKKDRVLDPN